MNQIVAKPKSIEIIEPQPSTGGVVVHTEAATLMEVIAKAAADPNADVGKIERLMGLYERITERQAEQAFNAAMSAAQREMPQVVRDADNDQTKSKYARLETISAAMTPVVTKHGFGLSFGTDAPQLPNHYGVTCLVSHDGGCKRLERADIPIDIAGMKGNQNKTATHAFGSTMSYGRRYLKLMIFDVQLKNEDDDGKHAAAERGFLSEEQIQKLQDLIIEVGADSPRLFAHLGVPSLREIYADKFDAVVKIVSAKRGRS